MTKDEPAGQDVEVNKDELVGLDRDVTKDEPAGQDVDVNKDEPSGLDGNMTKDKPAGLDGKVNKDEPAGLDGNEVKDEPAGLDENENKDEREQIPDKAKAGNKNEDINNTDDRNGKEQQNQATSIDNGYKELVITNEKENQGKKGDTKEEEEYNQVMTSSSDSKAESSGDSMAGNSGGS